jgi:predicted dehydrogenase
VGVAARPRFGIIGTGVWVRNLQAPVAARSDAVAFSAIFGRNREATAALAAAHGVMPFADLVAFLDAVDVVGICVPPAAQQQFALAAAAAGKPVLLEKPVAMQVEAADAIATAFAERNLASLVFFTQLLMPRVRLWLRDVRAKGGWFAARIDNLGRVLTDPDNPFHATAWRAGAGALWDTGPHAVALLSVALGPVAEVSAVRGEGDFSVMTLVHANGALSTINLRMDAPAPLPGETALFGAAGKTVLPPTDDWDRECAEAYAAALQRLADPSRTDDIALDAAFGATVTRVLAAAERSMTSGRRESVG